ncbi:MAG: hypothetical protein GY718_10705 [Lentisphaerae bacterium]|nr:hypothetical protein [Lentisphaerota bacterium]
MERQLITKIGNNEDEYDGWFDIGDKRVKYWQLQGCNRIYQTAKGNWLHNTWGIHGEEPDIFRKCTPVFAMKKLLIAGTELPDILLPLIADDEV